MSNGEKPRKELDRLSRLVKRLKMRGIEVDESMLEEVEEIEEVAAPEVELVVEVKAEPVVPPKMHSWKQRQIITTMRAVMRENHTLNDWKKKYGAGIPDVVAQDLWQQAKND